MIDVVIIGKNEGASVQQMYNALKDLPFIENRIWVVDRSTDNTAVQLEMLGEMYIKTSNNLQGRQSSYCRNLGLRMTNPKNDVLFLDGDRFPVSGDLSDLTQPTADITLLKLEHDVRDNVFDWEHRVYGRVCNMFFSCGLLITRNAILRLQAFQNGEVFDTEMQSLWGVEDTYLGDVCFHLGLSAQLHPNIRLNGGFDQTYYTDFEPLKLRFSKRDRLNLNVER